MKQDAVNVDAINLEANSRMIEDENCVYGGMAQTEGPHCKDSGVEIDIQNDTESASGVCQINLKRDDCFYGQWDDENIFGSMDENNIIHHYRYLCNTWVYRAHGGYLSSNTIANSRCYEVNK
ncbi:uncharacterized protein LOC142349508 [Convolutriloba macropyga]|uniref:uncharacterized protein LOC142349508 n=1 Tax=Convolutriloba macropyga TaxID=536237 RepID=UPI003F51E6F0